MEFSCSQQGIDPATRLPRTRRSWTHTEEKCLIEAFKDIIQQGWKADNGFKHGFLIQLENKLKVSLPGTDLRVVNINSKYGTWKKAFKDVWDTLKNSGFNWSSGTYTVAATDSAWDAWCLAHPQLAYIRNKPFPFYELWVEMFGKDTADGVYGYDCQTPRGTRNHSQPPPTRVDDAEESINFTANQNGSEGGPVGDSGSPPHFTPPQADSPRDNAPSADTRKRKRIDTTEELIEVITKMWGKATDSIDRVALRMGREMDEAENRKMLVDVIEKLPMVMTNAQRLKATFALAKDEKALDVFHVLCQVDKVEVVSMILEGMVI